MNGTDGLMSNVSSSREDCVENQIRSLVRAHARLSVDVDQLGDGASLYQAGMTSHAGVNLMLALEDHFGIEFPERMLRRRTFESIAAITAAIGELNQRGASAA
jgi:acyl carrier protein